MFSSIVGSGGMEGYRQQLIEEHRRNMLAKAAAGEEDGSKNGLTGVLSSI